MHTRKNFGVVSWLSKNGSEKYNNAVTETKMEWLANHMPSVKWNEIKIVEYGTPKSTVVNVMVVFCSTMKKRTEQNGMVLHTM